MSRPAPKPAPRLDPFFVRLAEALARQAARRQREVESVAEEKR